MAKKNKVTYTSNSNILPKVIVVIVLIAGLVATIYLATHITQFFSQAANPPIVIRSANGSPLPLTSGNPTTTSPTVQLILTAPSSAP